MTDDELLATARKFASKWQPRLRLAHFDARVVLADAEEDAPARFTVPAYEQQALIIVRPDVCASLRGTYPVLTEWTDEQLIEMAIVHELAHVVVVAEWQAMNRHLDWLTGKKGDTAFFADMHSAWLDLDEAFARRMTRILLEADRGAWVHD